MTVNRNDPRLNNIKPDGQQEAYLVLPAEERERGFVRPYRDSYVHIGRKDIICGKPDSKKPEWICVCPKDHEGECWAWGLKKDIVGCGAVTRMGSDIAETYARNPKFYGATYCIGCKEHLPVSEFVWDGTDERVGS